MIVSNNINMDGKSVLDLAQNSVNRKGSQIIKIKYHWIRGQLRDNIIH